MIRKIIGIISPLYEIILVVMIFCHAVIIGNLCYRYGYKQIFEDETRNIEEYMKDHTKKKTYIDWINQREYQNQDEDGPMDD